VSQQDQVAAAPANASAPMAQPAAPTKPAPPATGGFWGRFAIPLLAVLVALGFVALATSRWNEWTGAARIQETDDAYIRADLTRLSSRVAGEVLTVAVDDFQRVKAGELLVQIDPADYKAVVDQAEAGVIGAQAALDNLANQIELQYATIAQAEAARLSAEAIEVETREENERQQSLSQTDAGTRQRFEQATAAYAKAQADVRASRAVIAAQRHQLEVLQGTKKQRAADVGAAKAALDAAKLKLGYTHVVAPFDGVTGERQVQPGDYLSGPDAAWHCRAHRAGERLAIRAAAAGQCHRQFHQGRAAHPGPYHARQESAAPGSPAAGHVGRHQHRYQQ
jgi:membrane fusion protein (multidrug efflux system)